ncbi:ABC transporter substrate-binding protein [Rhodococcus sp. Eu-32]|uniref:ABC transporter substrate-binding protein n=1 Tax=Rhodococcus sp. Eu-32 TaxID=1017319 RepID=UPI000DF1AE71|nr:ABC transporter substrate-binding protein [Rhodococcus sp. Eu-32]RRQ27185.1 ABC transporter substrate-binding protein [Rhodococcus sp. Eu-32]
MSYELGRRRFLGLSAALLGSGLLAACGEPPVPRAVANGSTVPVSGGRFTYLNEKLIDGYQQQSTGSWHVAQVWNQLVERLFYYDAGGNFVPHLATGYTENDDRTEFGLTIRQGVTFSNGERLDAAAVAENLNFLGKGDKERGLPRSAYFPTTYGEAVAVDDYQVRVRLTAPFGDFIQKLGAWTTVGILAPETIRAGLEEQSDLRKIHGTGPFVVESWLPSKEVVLRRREDYAWARDDAAHNGPAHLERVTVQQVVEPSLRTGSLQAGQVDLIHYVQPTEEPFVARDFALIAPSFFGSVWGLQLRLTAAHLDDIRVRKALTHGVDRADILTTNYPSGAWKEAKSTFNDVVPGTLDLRDRFAYDPDLANSLLDDAGWTEYDGDGYRVKDGEQLSFLIYPSVYITTSEADLQLIAQHWRRIGVRLQIEGTDFSNYNSVTAQPSVPLYENHWLAGSQTEMWRWWHSSQANQFKAPGPELDALLDTLVQATSNAERIEASKAVQEYVIDNAYYIPVHEFIQTWGASNRLKGLSVDGLGLINFYDAWIGDDTDRDQ